MVELVQRDVPYGAAASGMLGMVVAPAGAVGLPAVLLVHDAFGLGDDTIAVAKRIARRGYAVFAADVWGGRRVPAGNDEIDALIQGMASQRDEWVERISMAHTAAGAQAEIDATQIVALGHCFGGSSVLEYLRLGATLRGVVSVHGGLDLVEFDWTRARSGGAVLVCTGADDPMATAEQRELLQAGMDSAAVDWEVDLYSGTVHAFTSERAKQSPAPHVIAHHERSAVRAWDATLRFLRGALPHPSSPTE